jgi:hypothetical protein
VPGSHYYEFTPTHVATEEPATLSGNTWVFKYTGVYELSLSITFPVVEAHERATWWQFNAGAPTSPGTPTTEPRNTRYDIATAAGYPTVAGSFKFVATAGEYVSLYVTQTNTVTENIGGYFGDSMCLEYLGAW